MFYPEISQQPGRQYDARFQDNVFMSLPTRLWNVENRTFHQRTTTSRKYDTRQENQATKQCIQKNLWPKKN